MIPFSRGTALVPVGVGPQSLTLRGYAASSRSQSLSTVVGPKHIHPIWIANVDTGTEPKSPAMFYDPRWLGVDQ